MMRVRKKSRIGKWIRLVLPLIIFLGAGIGIYCYIDSLAFKVCRVEAGMAVTASDFMKNRDPQACFTEDSTKFDVTVPGEYKVVVQSGWFRHKCNLIVQDTIAPAASGTDRQIELGESLSAEAFVTDITDATKVSVAFETAPDFTKAGLQQITLLLTDLGGNTATVSAELNIIPVFAEVVMEAGNKLPSLSEFVIRSTDAAFRTDMDAVDIHKVQEVKIEIQVDGNIYESLLRIVDTTAPVVTVQELTGYTLVPREPQDFAVSIQDETAVTVSFVKEPDLTLEGTQEIGLRAVDEGGNETTVSTTLTLAADTEAPVITGEPQVTLFIGDTIAYRKLVDVTDNCEEGLELTVESSQVNLNAAGTYPVTYTATDLAGNRTEMTVELTILEREHSIEEVTELADAVLARIITDTMTPLEKVQAIYNYNMSHIGYINHSDRVDWVKAAYEGLALGKGDCYVYASTAKLLLTRAGIKNMDIEKIPAKTLHYWNLVDIGDGWYHFDTTPRKDRPTIFMWTDAQMMEYSNSHNKSHNYDRELYPVIN